MLVHLARVRGGRQSDCRQLKMRDSTQETPPWTARRPAPAFPTCGTARSFRSWSITSGFRTSRRCSTRSGPSTATWNKRSCNCRNWAKAQRIPGMPVEVVRLDGRTPLIFIEVPGSGDDCVLLYGHLDKQPEMTGWAEHLGPWTAGDRGRQALRPRRRRRWLCDLRFARGDSCAAGAERRARALRGDDRSLRGIGQLRSAVLRRSSRRAHRQTVADRVSGFGLRQLRADVADDVAARHDRRQSDRARCSTKACIRAMPPAWSRRVSASCASCCRGSKIRTPAGSSRRNSTSRFRRSASSRRSSRPRCSAMRFIRNSRSSKACGR